MTPRRHFLRHGLRLATLGCATAAALPARAGAGERSLALAHTHTGERLQLVYAAAGGYLPPALGVLDRFLRDHYSGTVGRMDPGLYDLMHAIAAQLGRAPAFEIISAYRCPETNERLRLTRGGGVGRRSLHMDGQAVDLRLPGVPLDELRDAALALRAGGVGYYPREQFVHVDTGRVRRW